ncbi:tRNA uracil 4-sulfurtransferase ThiI [Bounagaea algeriensis]
MPSQPCVLLKHGELAIKGRNRGVFERHLLRNLEWALGEVDSRARVERRAGVLVVTSPNAQDPQRQAALVERAREVIGISVVQPGVRTSKDPKATAQSMLALLTEQLGAAPRTFAVRARRRDKNFRMTSSEMAAYLGQRVVDELGWPVDLDNPDTEITVEVDWRETFVSVQHLRGQGGLPVGSSGRALSLLSGGYDSPVAAHRMMRRGLHCDFLHFTGAPYTGPSSTYKAYALVRQLNRFQGGSRLHVVPIGKAQRALATAGAGELQIVAQRRLIVRVGTALAQRLGDEALVTGDSLGQVSSQTLSNMATTEQAAGLPVLRPLLAWDKQEIMGEAANIGTAEISKLPDEDCCSLIMPPNVATHSQHSQLHKVENRVGFDDLIEEVLDNIQVLEVEGERAPTASCEADASDAEDVERARAATV